MNTWKIDPIHSEIKFKVRHLIVSTVTGQFKKFDAVIEVPEDDFGMAKVSFEAEVNSIDTNNADRDTHLKSEDFFDAAKHPKMTFLSKSISKISDEKYKLTGDMTIRGTTKETTLDVVYNGKAKGFDGIEVAGFEITGKLSRLEFGLKWNAALETGGVVVSDEVKLEIFAEMKKETAVHSGKTAA
jgi:polyisoprenoid-binding protein YceI